MRKLSWFNIRQLYEIHLCGGGHQCATVWARGPFFHHIWGAIDAHTQVEARDQQYLFLLVHAHDAGLRVRDFLQF